MGDQVKHVKRIFVLVLFLVAAFAVYVEIVNQNTRDMTYRQKVLKAVYPLWMWWAKLRGKNITRLGHVKIRPPLSFYSLKAVLNNGDTLDFASLKGKKVLLVNTASDCGYTNQYTDLQELYSRYKSKLWVIGFPANDFKQQEKGDDESITRFCKLNYGISFPLVKKSIVIMIAGQHPVYQWLTDSSQNGWNNKPPSWNFCKYLVDEEGRLTNYFGSTIPPLSKAVTDAVK